MANPRKMYMNKAMKSFVIERDFIKDIESYDCYIKEDDIVPFSQLEMDGIISRHNVSADERNNIVELLNDFQNALIEKIKS